MHKGAEMSLIQLPPVWEFPSEVVYRLNVFAIAEGLGLDIRRLAYVREAVRLGVFSDWPKEVAAA